jgi:hypothetical protein
MKWDSPENQFKTINTQENVQTIMDILWYTGTSLIISMIGSKELFEAINNTIKL